ncbi:MAG: hypothetical protein C0399_01665 [Syntrophus sp. (in: bacteria)]|nr:hypothetical protein [Syntrophus sp. (in: bacteria)]
MMRTFFYPESIAVFGVSDAPKNLARTIIENLQRFGFGGAFFAIGTSGGTIAGKPVLNSLDELEETPELAVLLVPALHIPSILEACGKKGIRSVIIESGGFSELTEKRSSLEEEVKEIAARYGMKIVGPNCFGAINLEIGLVLPFFILNPQYMRPGSVSLISQSGGIFYDTCMLCSVENVGLRKLVSIGNKLITNENDVLEYISGDPDTRVIGLYLENFSNGRRFMDIAAQSDKPIVLLKANRSLASQEIARFHTTAIAGDDDIAGAAMRQAGIHRVQSFQEMVDCFKIFSLPLLKGPRLALISRSGGHGVVSADAAYHYGFELARFSEGFFHTVREKKLNVIEATNPLDIGDVYDLDEYKAILDMALQERGVDGVLFVVTYSSESDGKKIRRFIEHAAQITPIHDKPVAICIATNKGEWFAVKEAADFPLFTDVDTAIRMLKMSYEDYRFPGHRRKTYYGVQAPEKNIPSGHNEPPVMVRPDEAFGLLETYGLPVAHHAVVASLDEALKAADRIGYPVAVKTASPEVLHKSDTGGVKLNISGPQELEETLKHMKARICMIQKMVSPGVEVIVGGRQDREFGPVIVLGLGGIFVEIMKDMAIRVLPIDDEIAGEMVDELKGSAILRGVRGRFPADIGALKTVLVNTSKLLIEHPEIKNLDINPVIVLEEGLGCVIVDAKIERST